MFRLEGVAVDEHGKGHARVRGVEAVHVGDKLGGALSRRSVGLDGEDEGFGAGSAARSPASRSGTSARARKRRRMVEVSWWVVAGGGKRNGTGLPFDPRERVLLKPSATDEPGPHQNLRVSDERARQRGGRGDVACPGLSDRGKRG